MSEDPTVIKKHTRSHKSSVLERWRFGFNNHCWVAATQIPWKMGSTAMAHSSWLYLPRYPKQISPRNGRHQLLGSCLYIPNTSQLLAVAYCGKSPTGTDILKPYVQILNSWFKSWLSPSELPYTAVNPPFLSSELNYLGFITYLHSFFNPVKSPVVGHIS
jgi:hypothetical protein